MAIPFFYTEEFDPAQPLITLNEENAKHVVNVLRMHTGDQIHLTDGKGNLFTAVITNDNKKHCEVTIQSAVSRQPSPRNLAIAISLLKNASRFEWFLEKATEIGVNEIIPLLCERTEREHFRFERMNSILISAMLQSQQTWLPVLREPVKFENVEAWKSAGQNFIAHCDEGTKQSLSHFHFPALSHSLICIGPEGDFTKAEIEQAFRHNFIPVSLGETRLRSETAGVVAAVLLHIS